MGKINFKDLNLAVQIGCSTKVKINDGLELNILNYLTIAEKTDLIKFVVNGALDDMTGCFSPIRVEVYFSIGICKWYGGIDFDLDDLTQIDQVYDVLETNGIIDAVMQNIPEEELQFINELIQDTIDDIARYNSSAAGIIRTMTIDAGSLDSQISEIMEKIKNNEGLEALSVIKNAVGTD